MVRLLTTALVAQLAAMARADGCTIMENHYNTIYTIPVTIGSGRGQTLQLVPDAGSSDVVVDSSMCRESCGTDHSKYHYEDSNTMTDSHLGGTITYAQGSVDVAVVKDSVKVAGMAGSQVPICMIESAMYLEGFSEAPYDGICGMGPTTTSQDGSGATLLSKVGNGVFSMCFGGDGQSARLDIGNGIGNGYGAAVPIIGSDHWSVAAQSFEVNGSSKAITGDAILDTGTSFIGMPSHLYRFLEQKIGDVDPDCGNLDDLPDVILNIGDQKLTLTPHDYVVRLTADEKTGWDMSKQAFKKKAFENAFNYSSVLDGIHAVDMSTGSCGVAFFEESMEGDIILGIPFFRAYATKFNRNSKTVSFASVTNPNICNSCAGTAATTTSWRSLLPSEAEAGLAKPKTSAKKLPLIQLDKIRFPWKSRWFQTRHTKMSLEEKQAAQADTVNKRGH